MLMLDMTMLMMMMMMMMGMVMTVAGRIIFMLMTGPSLSPSSSGRHPGAFPLLEHSVPHCHTFSVPHDHTFSVPHHQAFFSARALYHSVPTHHIALYHTTVPCCTIWPIDHAPLDCTILLNNTKSVSVPQHIEPYNSMWLLSLYHSTNHPTLPQYLAIIMISTVTPLLGE